MSEQDAQEFNVSLFPVDDDARADGFTDSLKSAASDADAIFVASAQQSVPYREQLTAFLYNPVVILFIWLHTAFSTVRDVVRRTENTRPYMTAKIVADSTDIPVYRMEQNIFPVVKNQGAVWAVPSWLYMLAVLSTFAELVMTGNIVPFTITLAVTGLFAVGFLRTSRTERDLRRLREIQATIEEHGLDATVLVATPALVNRLTDILELRSLSYGQ